MTNRITDTRGAWMQDREMDIAHLLQRVWTYSFTTKSDYAREMADVVAECAARGFITTEVAPYSDLYGRLWKITLAGLKFLNTHSGAILAEVARDYFNNHCEESVAHGDLSEDEAENSLN